MKKSKDMLRWVSGTKDRYDCPDCNGTGQIECQHPHVEGLYDPDLCPEMQGEMEDCCKCSGTGKVPYAVWKESQ